MANTFDIYVCLKLPYLLHIIEIMVIFVCLHSEVKFFFPTLAINLLPHSTWC